MLCLRSLRRRCRAFFSLILFAYSQFSLVDFFFFLPCADVIVLVVAIIIVVVVVVRLLKLSFVERNVRSSARAPLILICAMRLKDYSTKDYSFALAFKEYDERTQRITATKKKTNERSEKKTAYKAECVNRNLSTDSFPSG